MLLPTALVAAVFAVWWISLFFNINYSVILPC